MDDCEYREPLPAYRTRISALFARDGTSAVLLRRGPKRHFHLISWDLETDTFTHGQWMKGIVRLCDLSPSGDKLLYWAAQYHASAPRHLERARSVQDGDDEVAQRRYDPLGAKTRAKQTKRAKKRRRVPRYQRTGGEKGQRFPIARDNQGVWTAVSRPPYFSALALWPCYGHWTGGGVFGGENEIILVEDDEGIGPVENTPIPTRMRVVPAIRRGWAGRLAMTRSAFTPEFDGSDAATRVAQALREAGARYVEWVNVRAGDDLLFACDGRVYRLANWRSCSLGDVLKKAWLLADLRDLSFELVRPPQEAMRW